MSALNKDKIRWGSKLPRNERYYTQGSQLFFHCLWTSRPLWVNFSTYDDSQISNALLFLYPLLFLLPLWMCTWVNFASGRTPFSEGSGPTGWVYLSMFLVCPETRILYQSNREADAVTKTWKRPPTSQQVKHYWRIRPIERGYESSASPWFQHVGQDQIGWLKQTGWEILDKCRCILCEGWRIGCGRSSSLNSLITSKQASSMNDLDLGQRPK